MGQKFSNNTLNTFLYLDKDEKPIKCKIISEDIHFNNNYIFWKPNKKINYLKHNKIRVLVEKKKIKFFRIFQFLLYLTLILIYIVISYQILWVKKNTLKIEFK